MVRRTDISQQVRTTSTHQLLGHVQPLLGVVVGGEEGDQVERSQARLPAAAHEDEHWLVGRVLADRYIHTRTHGAQYAYERCTSTV